MHNSELRTLIRFIFASFLFILLGSLLAQWIYRAPYPNPPGPIFDRRVINNYRLDIEAQKPQVLLLGDSMLGKGVDPEQLQNLMGKRVYKLDVPGGSSAIWYLIMKSNIIPADYTPETLVIFFRGTMLTDPTFRVNGSNVGLLDKYASPDDTLFLEYSYASQMSLPQHALDLFLPLYSYRAEITSGIDAWLRHTLPAVFQGCDSDCSDAAVDDVLRVDIKPALLADYIIRSDMFLYAGNKLDFASQVDHSFLPEIIRMAQKKGIKIIMVRMPTQIFPDPSQEPAGLKAYNAALQEYLAARDIPLLNFEHDPRFPLQDFTEPTHLTPEASARFTAILAQALEQQMSK